jgi:hypothetical protein
MMRGSRLPLPFRGSPARFPVLLLAGVLLASTWACGGDRALPGADVLRELEPGAPKADVLNALPGGNYDETTERRVLHGYPTQRYLVAGQLVEVVWVTDPGESSMTAPPRESRTPVLFVDNHLDGWGWPHFDARKDDLGLPEPLGPGEVRPRTDDPGEDAETPEAEAPEVSSAAP